MWLSSKGDVSTFNRLQNLIRDGLVISMKKENRSDDNGKSQIFTQFYYFKWFPTGVYKHKQNPINIFKISSSIITD